MASLQIIPLCFLFVSTQGCTGFADFKCDEDVTAELGESINMTCENNQRIDHAAVTFFPNKTRDQEESDLSSRKNIYVIDNGRISLMMINQSVIVSVHKVQISDQRTYEFVLEADNGHCQKTIDLKVVAPYSEPKAEMQDDTVVCTVSGGHPQRQLYWFDDHGTNLTHNSKLVSSKNEDGSFSLISTLQRQSLDGNTTCCCILNNNNTNCDKVHGSACVKFENKAITSEVSQAAEKRRFFLILIAPAVFCALALYFCLRRKRFYKNVSDEADAVSELSNT